MIPQCFTIGLLLVSQLACAGPTEREAVPAPTSQPRVGLLVMAHGGGSGWNDDVARAIEPLRDQLPTALAFGMADPTTLAAGLDSLATRGVRRVALVRVFVSGDSFLQRTAQLLRLGIGSRRDSAEPHIEHDLQVATHLDGLADWDGIAALVVQRVTDMSRDPQRESVLLLAHGQGSDDRNDRLRQAMEETAAAVRGVGFRQIFVATLREDWPTARQQAEADVRRFVTERSASGDRVIVVPFRLSGFGPYAEVLHGLSYVATAGFLPHPTITDWIKETAVKIVCKNGWDTESFPCQHFP